MSKLGLWGVAVVVCLAATAGHVQADDGNYCREYQQRVTIGGVVRETYGTACMQPDGSWRTNGDAPDQSGAAEVVTQDLQQGYVIQEPVYQTVYRQPVVYEQPYYGPVGLSLGFNIGNDWHGRGGYGGGNWGGGHGGGHWGGGHHR